MLTAVGFFIGASQFVIVGVLDKVASSLGISIGTAGQLVTAFAMANAIGAPLLMIAIARWKGQQQLILSLGIVILGIACTVLSDSYGVILLGRGLLGIGSGTFVAVSYTVAGLLASPNERAKAMANISMGFSLALVFGVPLGRMLTELYSWQLVFWLIGLFAVLSIGAVRIWIPSSLQEPAMSIRERLVAFRRFDVQGTLFLSFWVFLGYSVLNTYIAPFLQQLVGTQGPISLLLLLIGLASVMGSKTGGYLVSSLGSHRVLMTTLGLQVTGLLFASMLNLSIVLSIIGLLIWSLFVWAFGISQSVRISFLAPGSSGLLLTVNSALVQFGLAIGSALGAYALGHYRVVDLAMISAFIELIGFCIGAYFIRQWKRHS